MNDLENTYHWLGKQDPGFIYEPGRLARHMHAAAEDGDFSTAWKYHHELAAARGIGDEYQQALIYMECALAACEMHDPAQATQNLKSAISVLERLRTGHPAREHAWALAHWMLGNLLLPFSSAPSDIAGTWERSLRTFQNLANHPSVFQDEQRWYQERCAEMNQAIAEALTGNAGEPYLCRAVLQCGSLKSIEILDEIPSRVGPVPNKAGDLQLQPSLDKFRIIEKEYFFYNLRGSRRIVSLSARSGYVIVKVADRSMDKAGILPRDYVLLRHQNQAMNGDMVAALVDGVDDCAVLKTFREEKARCVLQPQSSDPEISTFGFSPDTDLAYRIFGVVLGVFKLAAPIEQRESAALKTPEILALDQEERQLLPFTDFLRTLPVYSEIPAGGPKAIPQFTGSFLELTRGWIDDKAFFIKNLRGPSRSVNLSPETMMLLKVTGDSMNRAGIEDGDYVVLRRQDTADNGDIIAAEIRGIDEMATLKRFRRRDGKVILMPESTNPKHEECEFGADELKGERDDQPFCIQGLALAVLKPLN
ncbi:MAG TPA: S24 family peptidase [Anaerolineales bacterium]|nr:S24 family peptidase [Anaerolineales bacterium]